MRWWPLRWLLPCNLPELKSEEKYKPLSFLNRFYIDSTPGVGASRSLSSECVDSSSGDEEDDMVGVLEVIW